MTTYEQRLRCHAKGTHTFTTNPEIQVTINDNIVAIEENKRIEAKAKVKGAIGQEVVANGRIMQL